MTAPPVSPCFGGRPPMFWWRTPQNGSGLFYLGSASGQAEVKQKHHPLS